MSDTLALEMARTRQVQRELLGRIADALEAIADVLEETSKIAKIAQREAAESAKSATEATPLFTTPTGKRIPIVHGADKAGDGGEEVGEL